VENVSERDYIMATVLVPVALAMNNEVVCQGRKIY
jgi:hypothetical protein